MCVLVKHDSRHRRMWSSSKHSGTASKQLKCSSSVVGMTNTLLRKPSGLRAANSTSSKMALGPAHGEAEVALSSL
eukprot:13041619-Alexandrium_andersonii.AAC.1